MQTLFRIAIIAVASGISLNTLAQDVTSEADSIPGSTPTRNQRTATAPDRSIEEAWLTSRRRDELAQNVPIPVTVVICVSISTWAANG